MNGSREIFGAEHPGSRPTRGSALDAVIDELARRQNGLVTRPQLLAAGVSDTAIKYRVASGRLTRLRPGLFSVGALHDEVERHQASILAVGPDAAVSHLSPAGKLEFARSPLVVDITTPRAVPRRDAIRLHRLPLAADEITLVDGLRVTSPTRTLFDLGTMLGAAAHAKAANEACVLRLVTLADLEAARTRYRGRHGATAFRRLLRALDPEGRDVRSPLETRLNTFLRRRGYPPWESNATLVVERETIRPDVLWRQQRVIVEADGRDAHEAPLRFASDRRRDRRLRVAGWEPVRVTSVDLDRRPDELDRDLRSLLRPA